MARATGETAEQAIRAAGGDFGEDPEAEETPQGRGPRAPANGAQPDDDLVSVREEAVELAWPLFRGARVIYLGGSTRKSITLRGSILIERWETEPAKVKRDPKTGEPVLDPRTGQPVVLEPAKYDEERTASESSGLQIYDFSVRDARGRLLTQRLLPSDYRNPILRGKRWARCEHPEHLRLFLEARDRNGEQEFDVQVPAKDQERFQRWVRTRLQHIGRQKTLQDQTMGKGR